MDFIACGIAFVIGGFVTACFVYGGHLIDVKSYEKEIAFKDAKIEEDTKRMAEAKSLIKKLWYENKVLRANTSTDEIIFGDEEYV